MTIKMKSIGKVKNKDYCNIDVEIELNITIYHSISNLQVQPG